MWPSLLTQVGNLLMFMIPFRPGLRWFHILCRSLLMSGTLELMPLNAVQADGQDFLPSPVRVVGANKERAMCQRQCTNQYKIKPIEKAIRSWLGYEKGERVKKGTVVETWMGISTDEATRIKDNRTWYIHNRYPLLDINLSRQDCLLWLKKHYPDLKVGKSACIGCPYHSNRYWKVLYNEYPDLFADVVEVDESIRGYNRMGGKVYLHTSGIPLKDVVKQVGEQGSLYEEECEGYCFL